MKTTNLIEPEFPGALMTIFHAEYPDGLVFREFYHELDQIIFCSSGCNDRAYHASGRKQTSARSRRNSLEISSTAFQASILTISMSVAQPLRLQMPGTAAMGLYARTAWRTRERAYARLLVCEHERTGLSQCLLEHQGLWLPRMSSIHQTRGGEKRCEVERVALPLLAPTSHAFAFCEEFLPRPPQNPQAAQANCALLLCWTRRVKRECGLSGAEVAFWRSSGQCCRATLKSESRL